ncbi:Na(+)/H(+) exchange regulatory cofactor NHE-RF2-like isoform X3 [Haliotis asinina]|uniref:Na(+)/H(+) exchange regulatory cofactor NHE-RF2-like isoform X3 n=1 Tax=Haliotis asinina TaxID=109174 RepID=UPI0035319E1C
MSLNGMDTHCKPRLCHLLKWPDFNGYGFNLHAEKGKAGQYIGKVDDGSPAQAAGLKDGDRIVEVNGVNIGNENHQQVVSRVKAGGDETRLLVVDSETDQHYKDERKVVRGDLPEVVVIRCPSHDPEPEQAPPSYTQVHDEDPVTEVVSNTQTSITTTTSSSSEFVPRLCHIKKRADFNGYGFNLHAERDKPGQFIGKIDEDSPAERADLREGDRIVAVNGTNIETESHQRVIELVKKGGEETSLLVVDKATDEHFKDRGITVTEDMPEVRRVSSVPVEPPVFSIPPPPTEDPSDDEEFNVDDFNEAVQERVEATQAAEVEAELPPSVSSQVEEKVVEQVEENADVAVETAEDAATSAVNGQTVTSTVETVTTYSAPEPEPEPEPEAEPEADPTPAPAPVSQPEPTPEPTPEPPKQANGTGDIYGLSAKEMKERLKSRRKVDPRTQGVGFGEKYKVFERL